MMKYVILLGAFTAFAAQAVDLKLVPQETRWLAEIDIKTIADSETGKFLKQNLTGGIPGDKLISNFAQQTGIDFAKDVTAVAFCGDGQGEKENAGFMIMRGQWNVAAVAAAFPKAKNFATSEHGKHVIMSWEDNGKHFACLVNNTLAFMASSEALVKRALDTFDGKTPNAANDAAFANFNPVAKKPLAIARVKDVNVMAANNQRAGVMQQITGISLLVEDSLTTAGVNADIDISTISTEAATQITTMIQGMQAMAQMQGANNPDLTELTRGLTVSTAGQKVSISLKLSRESLKKMIDTIGAAGKGNGAQGLPIPIVPPAFQ